MKKKLVKDALKCCPISKRPLYFINKPCLILSPEHFSFLNQERDIQSVVDWNDKNTLKLWLYNLHYHDGINCPETPDEYKQRFIRRWMDENPCGLGNGWEPYPLSLRIVNWIKWLLSGSEPLDGMQESLASQVHSLTQQLEYHLLGNHLFANAKALVFAGCFFEGSSAEKWLQKGLSILEKEIPEQFLPDGAHFELSTTYHATLSEDLLDIINILQAYGKPVPDNWKCTARKAVSWQQTMTRADGLPPLFNDAAYGISPSLVDITAYAERLSLYSASDGKKNVLIDLPASGYFRYDGNDYTFLGDAGQIGPDYIPGHAHCDMLNFELYAHGKPIIIDTGTSTYEVCDRRHRERSTSAHNIVQVGNLEQSEIWGAFRVARRAKIIERHIEDHKVTAAYKNYDGAYTHRRRFCFENQKILLVDTIDRTKDTSAAKARFHLHPDIAPKLEGYKVTLGSISLTFTGALKIDLTAYDYAPEFNKLVKAQCIEVTFGQKLETCILL